MQTYEYPLGVTFKASTPEHAAARVFGGKPWDYLAVTKRNNATSIIPGPNFKWLEVYRLENGNPTFVGDIPIVEGN